MFMLVSCISSVKIFYIRSFNVINLVEFYGVSSNRFRKSSIILTFGYDEIVMNIYMKPLRMFTRL